MRRKLRSEASSFETFDADTDEHNETQSGNLGFFKKIVYRRRNGQIAGLLAKIPSGAKAEDKEQGATFFVEELSDGFRVHLWREDINTESLRHTEITAAFSDVTGLLERVEAKKTVEFECFPEVVEAFDSEASPEQNTFGQKEVKTDLIFVLGMVDGTSGPIPYPDSLLDVI